MGFAFAQAEKWITEKAQALSVSARMLNRGTALGCCGDVRRVLCRLAAGEHITLLQLGGSITEGYFSTAREKSQGGQVFSFLESLFPGKVTFINAGIAATGAVYGAYRLPLDVLPYHPDLVIIEYNINDRGDNREGMAAYENIIRILRQKGIAVISLYNTVYSDNKQSAAGSRKAHSEIADFYSLPKADANLAYFGEEFYKKSDDEGSYFRETDGTHPTDAGHARVGLLVSYLLYRVMQSGATAPAALPENTLYPEGGYISADAEIIKAQEIENGHPLVGIRGGEYNPSLQSVGQNIILGANPEGFTGGTRQNNTYACYEIRSGESATVRIAGATDAFIIIMQNKYGAHDAEFSVCADGEDPKTLVMNAHYSGALTVEHSRIINCDHRVYHGEKRDITVTVTAKDGNVYIGGVMASFK